MLRQSPLDCFVSASDPVPSRPSPVLPPLNGVSLWAQMNKLQLSGLSKPFLRDRLRRLSDAPIFASESNCSVEGLEELDEEKCSEAAERRIRYLEHAITYLRQQQEDLLAALHDEVDQLKRENQDLKFRLVMAEEQIIVDRRRSALAQTLERERRMKLEATARELAALNYCEPIDRVLVSVPPMSGTAWVDLPQNPHQPGARICDCKEPRTVQAGTDAADVKKQTYKTDAKAKTAPLLTPVLMPRLLQQGLPLSTADAQKPSSAGGRDPVSPEQSHSVAECQAIIRQLQSENQRQANELNQLKSNLRNVVRSRKLNADPLSLTRISDTQQQQLSTRKSSATRKRVESGRESPQLVHCTPLSPKATATGRLGLEDRVAKPSARQSSRSGETHEPSAS